MGDLKRASSSLSKQNMFIIAGAQAVQKRKLNDPVATFLPTGLIKQLSDAMRDDSANPRLPAEVPGVYLCLSMSGLHTLPELPMEPSEFEAKVKAVFATIAELVSDCGGQMIHMTADSALCCWSLPDVDANIRHKHGSPMTPALAFDERRLGTAVALASKCALTVLDQLHDSVLWGEDHGLGDSGSAAQRRAPGANSSPEAEPTATPSESSAQGLMSASGAGKKSKLWGRANKCIAINASSALSPLAGLKRGPAKGLNLLDAVQAASKVAATGKGIAFRLSVGAALTVAIAQAIHVGGNHDRWEYVIIAPEIGAAHQVLTTVDQGELLIADSLWGVYPPTALQQHISVDEWKRLPQTASLPMSRDYASVERADLLKRLPLAAMKPYVAAPFWPKILAANPDWIIEQSLHRSITVIQVRMKAPKDAPLLTQVAAFTSAVSLIQLALYKHHGTFKHFIQDHGGCTVTACLGLPPFVHAEVASARSAVSAAQEIRTELSVLGLQAHAVVLTGKAWVGTVGSERRRAYAIVGEPAQLANQMLGFTTDEQPIIVDVTTSQANKLKYDFGSLPVTVRMPGQLKQHAMLALQKPKEDLQQQGGGEVHGATLPYDIAQWMRLHNKHSGKVPAVSTGDMSDIARQQMRECFMELDEDGSGCISIHELLNAIQEVDTAEVGSPRSLVDTIGKMMEEMDQDLSGSITFDEFIAMASGAFSNADAVVDTRYATHNLPLLLTALTTRRRLQNQLGDGFLKSYKDATVIRRQSSTDEGSALVQNRRRSQQMGIAGQHVMVDGDDAIDLEFFTDLVTFAEADRTYSDAAMKKKFDSFLGDRTGVIDRREYVQFVMLDRLCRGSSRAVELFLRMDTDRSGNISPEEFRRGMRSMHLGPSQGFTEDDANALFAALDTDNSHTIEYSELATTLQLTKTRQATIDRLRKQSGHNSPQHRRVSSMAHPSRKASFSIASSTLGSPRAGGGVRKITRQHRRASIISVLDYADAKFRRRASVRPEEPASLRREKSSAMQAMVNEVDTIYMQYRTQRDRLGPVRRPAMDRSGYLSALLSPRIQTDGEASVYGRVANGPASARGFTSPKHKRASPATSPPRSISMLIQDEFDSPDGPTPLSPAWSSPRSPPNPSTGLSSSPERTVATQKSDEFHGASKEVGVSPSSFANRQSNLRDVRGPERLPRVFDPPPWRFQGPNLVPKPPERSSRPLRPRPVPPPSMQLPPMKQRVLSREATPSSNAKRAVAARRGDEGGDQREDQKYRLRRQERSRDHHQHAAQSPREPSAWQKKLRRSHRLELVDAQTSLATLGQQRTKLQALRCLRDALDSDKPGAFEAQLELGRFGAVGLGIGSRPVTPVAERAMKDWVVGQSITAADVKALKEAEAAEVRANKIADLTSTEQRLWLSHPVKRASFAPIADILQEHGVREEFRLAGAPGLQPFDLETSLVDPNNIGESWAIPEEQE